MAVLTFKVKGNVLARTNMEKLVRYTRNNAFAQFKFDSNWDSVTPIVAQFWRSDDCCYDVEVTDNECAVPWEVLETAGKVRITVMGGDLIVTNSIEIKVYDSGVVGGLVPTEASPGIYSTLAERVAVLENAGTSTDDAIADLSDRITALENAAETATDEDVETVLTEVFNDGENS